MKFILRVFASILIYFFINISNVFAEGLLIFEVTDPDNKPVKDIVISIYQDGNFLKNDTTTSYGRVVESSFTEGNFSYTANYGDYCSDTFSVNSEDYTWIKLNFRNLTINFSNDSGVPLQDKLVTLYKINDDNSETYVGEKLSDNLGNALFTIPEGNYKYVTLKGEKSITVKDENKTAQIGISSGEITHQTHFCFINSDSTKIKIYASDITINSIQSDSVVKFGSVDVRSENISNNYYLFNLTENYVSCPTGLYTYTVSTLKYGILSDTFEITDNTRLENNIIYITLPTLPGDGTSGSTDQQKGNEKVLGIDETVGGDPYVVKINLISAKDSISVMPNTSGCVTIAGTEIRSAYFSSDSVGQTTIYIPGNEYNFNFLNDTIKSVKIFSDTTLYFYVNKGTNVYFNFFYGNEEFNPTSVSNILIYKVEPSFWLYKTFKGKVNILNNEYVYDDPTNCAAGNYFYTLDINEKGYEENIYGSFSINITDTIKDIDISLVRKYKVDIYITDYEKNIETRQYIQKESNSFSVKIATDSLGHYSEKITEGDYTYSAFDQTHKIHLTSDTTLYFKMKNEYQDVKFQFLHDGELVYPQIMSMDIYKKETDQLYSRVVSSYHLDSITNVESWVFEEPSKCERDSYYCKYTLKDYDYNGTYNHDFYIAGPGSSDTLIYIVIPVKRNVSICVKDANLDLVKGVFGYIYKYNEDGTLGGTEFDSESHSGIKTNTSGLLIDHLTPGRYQVRILDIVRDFIVSDYDLSFDIISGIKFFNTTYIVQYESTREPVKSLLLDINKENVFYNSSYTDENGSIFLSCEKGNYSYFLHYGNGNESSYSISKDTTIYILVEDPIFIENMEIIGCPCLSPSDTLNLSTLISPADATLTDLQWSIDNDILGRISSTGILYANNVSQEGYITVTAKSTDGSNIFANKKIHMGSGPCGSEQSLTVGRFYETDYIINSDTILLSVQNVTNDEHDRYFIYQTSKDTVNWDNIYGPTTERNIAIGSRMYTEGNSFFRVISSSSVYEINEFAKAVQDSCENDKISNSVICRNINLDAINWVDSICSSQAEVSLAVDSLQLVTLPSNVTTNWYIKTDSEDTYSAITNASGKYSITLPINESSSVKIALEKEGVILKENIQHVFVEDSLNYILKADKDTACINDEVLLYLEQLNGHTDFYEWANGFSDSIHVIQADTQTYNVLLKTKTGICAEKRLSLKLTIDNPVDFEIISDKDSVCASSNKVQINVINYGSSNLNYTWSLNNSVATSDTILVYPTETTSYTVTAHTELNACPSLSKEKTIKVSQPIEFNLSSNFDTVCYKNQVTITANVTSGNALFQWDMAGTPTTENYINKMNLDSIYRVTVSDANNICESKTDSIKIIRDMPVVLSILNERTYICETETNPVKISLQDNSLMGKILWSTEATGKSIEVLPKETTTYSVTVNSIYNKCPETTEKTIIYVNKSLVSSLEVDKNSICQTGEEKITLTMHTTEGHANEYIWWDGKTTTDSVRTVIPQESFSPWGMATDNVCANSGKEEIEVQVAKPTSLSLSSTNTIFEYGSDVNLVATPGSFVYGPYSWYAIDENNEESNLSETDENKYSDMPNGNTKYYVTVQNGACPEIKSNLIDVKLIDNIEIPTVFTPHEKNGENDDFMPGYPIIIYDRYGNIVCNSDNGWDGEYKNEIADAGVYIYVITLKDNRTVKGTIEIYKK